MANAKVLFPIRSLLHLQFIPLREIIVNRSSKFSPTCCFYTVVKSLVKTPMSHIDLESLH